MQALLTIRGVEADVVRRSLAPEAGREIPRCRVAIAGERGVAEVRIEADDVSALRAALNSYLRWAQVALDVGSAVGA